VSKFENIPKIFEYTPKKVAGPEIFEKEHFRSRKKEQRNGKGQIKTSEPRV
jgi:hypothetical protein